LSGRDDALASTRASQAHDTTDDESNLTLSSKASQWSTPRSRFRPRHPRQERAPRLAQDGRVRVQPPAKRQPAVSGIAQRGLLMFVMPSFSAPRRRTASIEHALAAAASHGAGR